VSFDLLHGEKKTLSDYGGQWLFINYWAAWCKPCLKEIPELNVLNSDAGIEVLAFNYDGLDKASLKDQVSKFDIQYRSLIRDPASLFGQPTPTGLPATMVINPKGEFVEWLYGAQTKVSLLKVIEGTRK
jgi:thiol-disulfide isomerase/thioredoxin